MNRLVQTVSDADISDADKICVKISVRQVKR